MPRAARPLVRSLLRVSLGLAALGAPAALAQNAPDVEAGPDGFRIRSADGRYELRLEGMAQGDARFFLDDGPSGPDAFLLRRARIALRGTLGPFAFKLQPDFGEGSAEITEGWGEGRVADALVVRAGRMKVPVSMEALRSSSDLTFVERGLTTSLVPRYDVGLMAHGGFADGRATYAAGVFNGVPDGGSGDGDRTDAKDVVARVFARPFRGAGPLDGLGLGVAAAWGHEAGEPDDPALGRFRTTGGRTFAAYRTGGDAAAAAVADGGRVRLAPQASFTAGPAQVYGEYVVSTQEVALGAARVNVAARAWQAAAAVVLTGEAATLGRVVPARPVGEGGPGAVEVAARYHTLAVEADAFPVFLDPVSSARVARAFTVGVNWYPTAVAKVMLNVERTSFAAAAGGVAPPGETLVLGRFQVAF